MTKFSLNTPASKLFMVGKSYASRLKRLEIKTVKDLLHHYPFRYEDLRLVSKINQLQAGEKVTIRGEVLSCENIFTRFGKKIQKALIADKTGHIEVVWFNQPYLPKALKPGTKVSLAGRVEDYNYRLSLVSPEYEIIKTPGPGPRAPGQIHTGRLVPIYPETAGLSSKWLRSRIAPLVKNLVPEIEDFLPSKIKKENCLIDLNKALKEVHFPKDRKEVKEARARLGFDELFIIQLNSLIQKKRWQQKKLSFQFEIDQEKVLQFIASLPFKLTRAQNKTIKEILEDLGKDQPMNRLLEGDVGSGKTVVACLAAYMSFLNNLKTLFMAPTEILTQQHFKTIKTLLEPLGVKVALLTGAEKSKELDRKDVIIGTHALIFKKTGFKKVGLVIIDEQHRFGVKQRAKLIKTIPQDKISPHILTMTATPIPRTMALTFYGDLDLSVLDQMPEGRKEVKTWVVPLRKHQDALGWLETEIKKKGVQAFIICPLIEESITESMKDIKNVTQEFEKLKQLLPKLKIGLLHGRLKAREKKKILEDLLESKIDILVSTPVVEVGIDIPNATIMLVEGAERFGLAQLHQLRGRVGRGERQSYCLLFAQKKSRKSLKRLKAMEKINCGFKLAEIDLKLRGPGEIYGTRQHGFMNLKIASLNDLELVKKTREVTAVVLKSTDTSLAQYPLLKKELQDYTIRLVEPN